MFCFFGRSFISFLFCFGFVLKGYIVATDRYKPERFTLDIFQHMHPLDSVVHGKYVGERNTCIHDVEERNFDFDWESGRQLGRTDE